MTQLNDLEEILYDEQQLQTRIAELGQEIARDYKDKHPVLVCVLTGAIFFFTDLCKKIDIKLEPDFIKCTSYHGTQSTGQLEICQDLKVDIEGRNVIIVEDIIDSGLSLHFLREKLLQRNPASLKICVLFAKNVKRKYDVPIDYTGFNLVDKFIVGYGFDYLNYYRNVPVVGVLKKEVYEKDV